MASAGDCAGADGLLMARARKTPEASAFTLTSLTVCEGEQQQEQPPQAQFAASRVEPFALGVDAAALAARADADRGHAQRQWNVGVRRGDALLGADGKMAIDSAQQIEQQGIGRQQARRPVADFLNGEAYFFTLRP